MTFQTSVATALPLVAPLQCPDTAAAIVIVAQSLQPDLAQGFKIDSLRLRLEMVWKAAGRAWPNYFSIILS